MSSDHQARRRGQPAVSARSDASPVAKADLPGQTIWTWFETAALPEALVLPFRIAVNLAGAVSAAFFARATLQFYWRTHSLIGGAFLVEQTWFVIAYLVRRPARGFSRSPASWLFATGGTFAGLMLRPVGVHWHWGVGGGLGLCRGDGARHRLQRRPGADGGTAAHRIVGLPGIPASGPLAAGPWPVVATWPDRDQPRDRAGG
jgi:hypothetical protein